MRLAKLLFCVFCVSSAFAQYNAYKPILIQEYELQARDSGERKPLTRPQKATLLSAVIPGAGQIYNGKYWKAGVVYAGAAGLIYMFKSNTDSMNYFQEAYKYRLDGDSNTIDTRYAFLSDAAVKTYRDYHRRLRDISILGFIGLYAIQIIDANVDAHLYEFKVNEDLSLKVEPKIVPSFANQASFNGLKLSIRF